MSNDDDETGRLRELCGAVLRFALGLCKSFDMNINPIEESAGLYSFGPTGYSVSSGQSERSTVRPLPCHEQSAAVVGCLIANLGQSATKSVCRLYELAASRAGLSAVDCVREQVYLC